MTAHVKSGGTWRELQEIYVKSGGSWREVTDGWVKSGGTWRQFFVSGITISAESWLISDGGSIYDASGYADSSVSDSGGTTRGSIDPTTWDGNTILGIFTREQQFVTGYVLHVVFDGTVAEDAFTEIVTNMGTFQTATRTSFSQSGGQTRWTWQTGDSVHVSGTVRFVS